MQFLAPDLVYVNDAFCTDLAVVINNETGRIDAVVPVAEADTATRLHRRALIPGFLNAHSHAFQRLLRGRTHWRETTEPSADFWSWRSLMYASEQSLTPDEISDVAHFCFIEMLRAG